MNETTYNGSPELQTTERVGAGILGALLLSLVGGAISFALSRVNIIAGIAGLVSILLGYWGYCKFAGVKYSMKGLVIAIVLSVLVQIGAYYFSLAFELWMQLKDEIPGVTLGLCMEELPEIVSSDSEIMGGVVKDLGLLLLFMAIASFYYVRTILQRIKAEKANEQPAAQENFPDLEQ